MKKLFKYIWEFKKPAALALLMAVINQCAAFTDPLITGKIVDDFVQKAGSHSQESFTKGIILLVGLALLAVTIARLANNFQDYFTALLVKKIDAKIYSDGIRHSIALPYYEFEGRSSGATLGIIQKVKDDVGAFITVFVNVLVLAVIGFIFVFFYSISISWKVTAIYFASVPIIIVLSWYMSKKIKAIQERIMHSTANLSGKTTENLRNLEMVKSMGLGDEQADKLRDNTYQILDMEKDKIKKVVWISFFQGTMVNLLRSVMVLVLLFLIFDRELSAGQYITFLLFSFFLFNPLQEIGNVIQNGRQAQVSMKAFNEIIDKPLEKSPEHPEALEKIDAVCFEGVSYQYDGDRGGVHDINLKVKSGEMIAFVGPSGSGKSTLIKLLAGLYQPQEGKISFGGSALEKLHLDELRKRIGTVTQDTQLFSGSIRENLVFVKPDACDDDCYEALDKAACASILEKSSDKLDALIGESGLKISGGEKQRLAIARALLRKPEILIFDEATSALDSITEEEITRTIVDVAKSGEHITILIAHRLSTIKFVNCIYVLENGGIVESGNHDALLEQKGLYYAMWRQQVGKTEQLNKS